MLLPDSFDTLYANFLRRIVNLLTDSQQMLLLHNEQYDIRSNEAF